MKKIGNEIFSAEINSPSIEVVSLQLMKDVPTLMQSAIYGALCRIYCKNGVLTIHFSLSSWQISRNFCPNYHIDFWKSLWTLSTEVVVLIKYWETGLLSFSHTFLHAISWLICNVWGTLFVSSNGRRRRIRICDEREFFLSLQKNNSGMQTK